MLSQLDRPPQRQGPPSRSAGCSAAHPVQAMFVHTQVIAVLLARSCEACRPSSRSTPRPIQYDELGAHYGHATGSRRRSSG